MQSLVKVLKINCQFLFSSLVASISPERSSDIYFFFVFCFIFLLSIVIVLDIFCGTPATRAVVIIFFFGKKISVDFQSLKRISLGYPYPYTSLLILWAASSSEKNASRHFCIVDFCHVQLIRFGHQKNAILFRNHFSSILLNGRGNRWHPARSGINFNFLTKVSFTSGSVSGIHSLPELCYIWFATDV